MREILFRCKAIGGSWKTGSLLRDEEQQEFCGEWVEVWKIDGYEIDPATVGQFIGLPDKNGKKIFDGDIVELFCKGSREHERYEVFYDVETEQLLMRNGNDVEQMYGQLARNDLTVVGNIYDNPELLEERK